MPSFDDIMARLEVLESKGVGPSLQDLPLTALRNWLEQNWRPGAQSLIEPGSITPDLLGGAFVWGVAAVVWPGGSPNATTTTVKHALGRQPTAILFGSATVNAAPAWSNQTTTQFDLNAQTVDGSSPALGTTRNIAWLAI